MASNDARLVLGLGNPGARYEGTRHTVGFRVVELLAERLGADLGRLQCNALCGSAEGLLLAAPQTYMNRSGYSARCLLERHEIGAESLLVVYDDVWLPLGRLRHRQRGGPGGHRGMESVIANLRTDEVPRLRLGVGWEGGPPDGVDLVEYVLEPFETGDEAAVDEMIERAADACLCWAREGSRVVMDRFNNA